jgi:hypothetical protein
MHDIHSQKGKGCHSNHVQLLPDRSKYWLIDSFQLLAVR